MSDLNTFVWFNIALGVIAKLTAALVVVWLLAAILRRRSAALRHGLWTCAMCAALALPVVAIAIPPWQPDTPVLHELPGESLVWPPAIERREPAGVSHPSTEQAAAPGTGDVVSTEVPLLTRIASIRARTPMTPGWMSWMLALWGAGAALALMRLALGVRTANRMVARGRASVDPAWSEAVARARAHLGIRRPIRMVETNVSVPAVVGVFRPTIALPIGCAGWSATKRDAVLVHELAHIDRWDNFTQLIASLAACVFWFHPVVWLGGQRMRVLREQAADDAVLRAGMPASDYGELLLAMARAVRSAPLAASMARLSLLPARIAHLCDSRRSRASLSRRAGGALAIATLAIALAIGGIGVDPRIAYAVERERAASYPRAPLAAPAREGRAADEYAKAEALAAPYRFYDPGTGDSWDEFLTENGGWERAPAELRALAVSPAAAQIVDHVVDGASRIDGKTSFRTIDWLGVEVDTDHMMAAIDVRNVMDAVAADHVSRGDFAGACRIWFAMLQYGQDLTRGTGFAGFNHGSIVQQRATAQLRRMVARGDVSDAVLAEILVTLEQMLDSRPTLGDAFRVEALWRGQFIPELADLADNNALVSTLEALRDAPAETRIAALDHVYVMRHHERRQWSRLVRIFDHSEAWISATYLFTALYLDHRNRGKWAPDLDSLSPTTLIRRVPLDPATGAAFRYQLREDGTAVLESDAFFPGPWSGEPLRTISLTLRDGC